MKVTKEYCDNCEREINQETEELTKISLHIKFDERTPHFSKEICDDCMKDLGFIDHRNPATYTTNYVHGIRNALNIVKSLFKRK